MSSFEVIKAFNVKTPTYCSSSEDNQSMTCNLFDYNF